jgi:hypothetical protein
MQRSRQKCRIGAHSFIAAFAVVSLLLALPVDAQPVNAFDKALAQIDEALATNPNGVSEDSLRSCRSMRKTAVLLRKMGHHARAVRRLKSCLRLLGFGDYRSHNLRDPDLPWAA